MKKINKYLFLFMMYVLVSPVFVYADLNYVGCGTAEGIPQPLVQMTRMLYTFLVVITPIILVATSILTMVKALKEKVYCSGSHSFGRYFYTFCFTSSYN